MDLPVRALDPRNTRVRAVIEDQEEGIVPLMVDPVRVSCLSFVRPVIASGRDPERQAAVP